MVKISSPFKRSRKNEQPPAVPTAYEDYEDGHGAQMSLFEHLNELRVRLTRAFLALAAGTIIGFVFAGPALDFIRGPYCEITNEPANCELVTLGPTEGIVAYLQVSIGLGAAVAMPVIVYQVMMFILPALTRKEKRHVLMALPATVLLFVVGAAFAWFILMPPALGFLEGFQPLLFEPEWTARLYLSFVVSLVFWMGVAFETPLVFFVLSLFGVVSAGPLVRNWRVAVVGAAIAAAFITPTIDPVNMALVMAPLMGLYVFSILLVMIGRRIAGLNR
jgi:sec-independent protein translocase protein TatC